MYLRRCHCSEDQRGRKEPDEEAKIPQMILRQPICQRILMKQYAFNPREKKSGKEKSEERERETA